MNGKNIISPNRRYVAICNTGNFDGHYFRSFTLPERVMNRELENNADVATWYFLNVLNFQACVDGCVTEENFKNIKEERVPEHIKEFLPLDKR